MKRFLFFSLITVIATVAFGQRNLGPDATPVHRNIEGRPTTLFSQTPNASNGIFSDPGCDACTSGAQSVADDFILSADTAISSIIIWGGYHPSNIPNATDAFSVNIYTEGGGAKDPDVAVWSGTALASTRSTTGSTLFGVDEYQFEITLNTTVLSAGTYWIEVTNDTTGNTDDFFWETGDLDATNGIAGSVWATTVPGSNWSQDPSSDFALMINAGGVAADDVPTLSTLGLIIFSLSLLVIVITIKRRS